MLVEPPLLGLAHDARLEARDLRLHLRAHPSELGERLRLRRALGKRRAQLGLDILGRLALFAELALEVLLLRDGVALQPLERDLRRRALPRRREHLRVDVPACMQS